VSPNSCNTKLVNGGDDRGLSDIRIVLRVSSKLNVFFRLIKTLCFLGEIDKTPFRA